jgi:DNA-binding CsgD family transcriptional regulator
MVGPARPDAEPLLERAAEVAAITAALEAARAGAGVVLVVEGAAGIGKTRLLTHACEQAAAAGMTVLSARAAEYEEGYAWGVVRQLFERFWSGQSADSYGGLPPIPPDLNPSPDASPSPRDEYSFAVLHGLYWLTADIAQRAPLLIAIDDFQWADPPSQRFVAHLARRLGDLPVLLAVTIREPRAGTVQDKAPTAELAAEPGVVTVCPAALSADSCARLVSAELGSDPSAAFTDACHELTGGNPLLLRGLVTTLTAEGIGGADTDVPHLRRLTPDTVSRHVLLRLGRMPASVLAAARAIAVLGTAATTVRAGRLASLDDTVAADAVGVLMAERLVEGELRLRFVHPLVRSAVYQDLALPVRQQWHKRAARLLAAEGAPAAELTVHLLASAAAGDPWVTGQLRQAAADARERGAPEVAAQCLERALAEPPPPAARADVLYELGAAQTFHSPASAVQHLSEALELSKSWPRRGEIALALSEALALCVRFTDAVQTVQDTLGETRGQGESSAPGGRDQIVASLQAVLLNIARWDLSTRTVTRPLVAELLARADAGEPLDPQLHANLAMELTVAGTDRHGALRHAREAVRATSRLMSLTSTALPEAVLVMSYADASREAWRGVQEWQELARQRGRPLAAAIAASIAAHIAVRDGDVLQALALGEQALAADDTWVAILVTAFLVPALVDAGDTGRAQEMLTERGLSEGELLPVFPFNLAQYARGCLRAATGDHEAAVADLLGVGAAAAGWGIVNPAALPWRSAAALSHAALGDSGAARRLADEELALARRWGASREIGVALRAAGLAAGGEAGIELLTEAVTVLRGSTARLELARALLDLGAARRRAGARGTARDLLREALDVAHGLGGHAIAARARDELVAAGGRPRRDAIRGREALTPSELRVAELAAAGRTNRQIAQALFVTQRTVENHLTSTYAKLGIAARPELSAALGSHPRATRAAPAAPATPPAAG